MRDDDLCKILELLLWHGLLTHACHHLRTAYNTDDINKGNNYHIFDMLSKDELVFALVEVHPWWACRLHPWLKQRWKMNSATVKYQSFYWKIWSGEKSLLIKLLECFQELLLALTWPPFQTQSDHLDNIQWTMSFILNSVSGEKTYLTLTNSLNSSESFFLSSDTSRTIFKISSSVEYNVQHLQWMRNKFAFCFYFACRSPPHHPEGFGSLLKCQNPILSK